MRGGREGGREVVLAGSQTDWDFLYISARLTGRNYTRQLCRLQFLLAGPRLSYYTHCTVLYYIYYCTVLYPGVKLWDIWWEVCSLHFSNTDSVERLSIEYWCIDLVHHCISILWWSRASLGTPLGSDQHHHHHHRISMISAITYPDCRPGWPGRRPTGRQGWPEGPG